MVQTGPTRLVKLTAGNSTETIRPLISSFGGLDFGRDLLPSY
ncbi:hypothetical protein [Hymenobacter fodinae]|nr:hypothetical protein [Hymenobacter fodinae]